MVSSVTTEKLDIAYDEALIVSELAIQIPKGQISSIIGPNGCGKSTILKAIGRILKPKCGAVYLSGDDIRRLPTKEVARRMAILPQSPTAPAGLSVSNLIAYGRFPHQKGFGNLTTEDKRIINWAIEVTRLEDFKHREVDSLSGGQRQRVWIAMALAQQTDLILLDEPTTYLDLAHQLDVLDFLHSLNTNQGTTIAMVLHDLNMAARFSDYMIAICEGRVIRRGTPEDVLRPEVLRQAFNIDAEIVKDPRTGRPTCITYDLIAESAGSASTATGRRASAGAGAPSASPVLPAASPKGSLAAATEGRQAVRA
jgi:iron complex transport system ATP-binding protein